MFWYCFQDLRGLAVLLYHVLEEENERKDSTETGQKAEKTEARIVMKKDSYQ